MPLNFPNSPSLNDEYTFGGSTYVWNGSVWGVKAATVAEGVHMSDTAPANPNEGDLWWRTNDGRLYIYYVDVDTSQWVEANSALTPTGAVTVSSTAPTSPNVGDLWYDDTDTHRMYIYYSDGTSSYWTDTNPDTRPQQLVGKFGARIVDNKGTTTSGGTSSAGVQTRELNTVEYDRDGIVTLASNQFTLAPGKWRIIFSAPAYRVGGHQAILVDVTSGNTTAAVGTTEFTSTGSGITASRSFGTFEVELTSNNVYRIDHWIETSQSSGLGVTNGIPAEDAIYTTVDIEAVESIVTTADIVQTGTSVSSVAAWGDVSSTGTLLGGLNVDSVTRTNTGRYSVVFTTPMPSSVYSVTVTGDEGGWITLSNKTSTGFDVTTINKGGTSAVFYDANFNFQVISTNALPPTEGVGADAWVGAQSDGTIDGSFNIASVTRTATGKYSVTFTTPMPTNNYAVTANSNTDTTSVEKRVIGVASKTTTGFALNITGAVTGNLLNSGFGCVVHASNASLPDSVTTAQVSKAWVHFDGTNGNVGDSFNVSSVTDNGTGDFTVNLTNSMTDTNYCVVTNISTSTVVSQSSEHSNEFSTTLRTTSSFRIRAGNTEDNTSVNPDAINVVVFGS